MNFIKNTLLGGLVFLVPFVVLFMIVVKAIQLMMLVAKPVDTLIPLESIGGIAVVDIIAVLLILITCFLAGLFARSKPGQRLFQITDLAMMAFIPAYAIMKERFFMRLGDPSSQQALSPVIVTFDDHAMVAFEVEKGTNGKTTVFLPGSPDLFGGNVVLVDSTRVEPLPEGSKKQVGLMLKKLGLGSEQIMASRLSQPSSDAAK